MDAESGKKVKKERDLFGKTPKGDRVDWSHRRGEPRGLALAWTIYLLIATVLSFGSVAVAGEVSTDLYLPASRRLLVLVTLGLTLLAPLMRLCQAAPSRPVRSFLRDMCLLLPPAVLLVMLQTVPWLAAWPLATGLAVAASLIIWTGLSFGVVGLVLAPVRRDGYGLETLDRRSGVVRLAATVVLLAVNIGVPAVAFASGRFGSIADEPRRGDAPAWWMASPMTASIELTRDRSWSGRTMALLPGHTESLRLTGIAACVPWLGAMAIGVARQQDHA